VRSFRATLTSVVIHGGLLVLAAGWLVRRPPPVTSRARDRDGPAPAPHEPAPIEVVYLPATTASADASAAPAIAIAAGPPQISRGGPRAGDEQAAPATPSAAPPHTPGSSLYMHMRGPSLHFSDAELDHMIDHPETPPPAPHVSGKLKSQPGGRAVIYDAVTTVDVERDGSAHFRDKSDFDIHFHLPIPSLHFLRDPERAWREFKEGLGDQIETWYKDPYAEVRKGPATELPEHMQAVPGQCDDWLTSSVGCEPEPLPSPSGIIEGKADLTAYAMRKLHVGDPYASRKRKLLDETFEERAAQGGEFRGDQLARAAELMRRNLDRLWAATLDPRERRVALFALWDECAEGDGPLGEAGERARAEVIGWIRTRLPAGTRDAYTPDEIAQLSRGRGSSQRFEPYEAPPP
jgi:hypothetical protein